MWTQLVFVFLFSLDFWNSTNGLILSQRISILDRLFSNLPNKFQVTNNLHGNNHDCYRTCVRGAQRTCVYNFTVERFYTMSSYCQNCPLNQSDCFNQGCITAGGLTRKVSATNQMVPGPSIFVCENDTVVVNVHNGYKDNAITIHWHGVHMIGTPWDDGVPFVTQCPILPNQIFQYKFSAYPSGTNMWHGHTGLHEADGLFGQLVVRKPSDFTNPLYDYDLPEHSMIVWHWMNRTAEDFLLEFNYVGYRMQGYDILINGLSSRKVFEKDGKNYTTPSAVFHVKKGQRYRFRAAFNAVLYCPMRVSIDNHKLTMIASDTGDFEPLEVDAFTGNAGERYDWVLHANQEVGTYWLRINTYGVQCNIPARDVFVHQEAIIKYEGSTEDTPSKPAYFQSVPSSGTLLNPVEQSRYSYPPNLKVVKVVELNSTTPTIDVSRKPDSTFYLEFRINGYLQRNLIIYHPQVNNISYESPPSNMLTQWHLDSSLVCDDKRRRYNCESSGLCTCPHIQEIGLHALVEVVLVNTDSDPAASEDHPVHLHGYHFQVVAMETLGVNITAPLVRQMNEEGKIKKNLKNRTYKDTISIPNQGFAVLRFRASNPGYWFIHCHFSDHNSEGMAMVFKVGEDQNIPKPIPPFPECQNYPVTSKHSPYSFT